MANVTISGAGAHASAADTDRIPASKAGVSGYLTPLQIGDLVLSRADLAELIRDTIAAALVAGSNVTITVDDAGNTITLTSVLHPGYVAGNWYWCGEPLGGATASTALVADTIYYNPFRIYRPITISDLGSRGNAAAGGNVKFAIYANDAATGRPTGTPLASTGDISTASAGNISGALSGGNVTLQPGTYWCAAWCDAAAGGVLTLIALNSSSLSAFSFLSGGTQANLSATTSQVSPVVSSAETYGAWPNAGSETLSVSTGSNIRNHLIAMKAA